MPDLLVGLLLIAFPLAAFAAAASLLYRAKAAFESKPSKTQGGPILRGALPVLLTVPLTPTVFGLVLWLQTAGIETDLGALPDTSARVVQWIGISLAWTAGLAIGSETIITNGRIAELLRQPSFGRVLILVVVQEIAVVFHLTLALIVMGRLAEPPALSSSQADSLIFALQGFAVSTLGLPIGAFLSTRVKDLLATRGFIRALSVTEVGTLPAVAGYVWGFAQIASV